MMKIGSKVLSKKTKDEYKLIGIRNGESGDTVYTFERKEDGNVVLSSINENALETEFYFLAEAHPLVLDKSRRKSKKTREKVAQPAEEDLTALSLLN